ncbi:MAG: hypothetical protein ACO1Q7_18140 [Gemmatimonas sp.]
MADQTVYALQTADAAALGNVEGVEVMVAGTLLQTRNHAASPRGAQEFKVARFTVRAADGVPATDGIVRSSGAGFELQLADGSRVAAPHLPGELRVKVGSRVFMTGPLSQPPVSFGLIAQPR